jgi:hypothetical protein
MRVALLVLELLIVARPIVHNGRYNHGEGKNTRKIFTFGIAKGGCFSLHARLYATAAASASPKARQLPKVALRWQVGDGQMSPDLFVGYRDTGNMAIYAVLRAILGKTKLQNGLQSH